MLCAPPVRSANLAAKALASIVHTWLGAVGTQVIQQSKADTAANLEALQPILAQLTKAGDNLPKSMQLLLTYPFSDGTTDRRAGSYVRCAA